MSVRVTHPSAEETPSGSSVEAPRSSSKPVKSRGDRLNPARSDRLYWILTSLRSQIEGVVNRHAADASAWRVVDFGCGNMPYRTLFEPLVGEYLGCDLPGNELADCVLDPNGRIPLPDESVDCVLSSQVLEHVPDPDVYLAEARRVLKPDAKLMLSTHGVWRYHPDPHDFWRWTSDGLKRQVTQAGFRVIEFRGVLGPAAAALQLWQDAVLPRRRTFAVRCLIASMQRLIQWFDSRCPDQARDRDAAVYFLVAEKI